MVDILIGLVIQLCVVCVVCGNQCIVKSWGVEVVKCMLMNNFDFEVVEYLEDFVVYGGMGKVVCSWEVYDVIVCIFDEFELDEMLFVQLGKLVGVFCIYEWVLCVFIVNLNLVGGWVMWFEFCKFEEFGFIMYGQMIVGFWIYIGIQGILQGMYEIFVVVVCLFGCDLLCGILMFIGGVGGMGGVQLFVVIMNDGVVLIVDVDELCFVCCVEYGYFDEYMIDFDVVVVCVVVVKDVGEVLLVGVVGNVVEVFFELLCCGVLIDIVIDQISVYDLFVYFLFYIVVVDWKVEVECDLEDFMCCFCVLMVVYVEVMVVFQDVGVVVFDYGNLICVEVQLGGFDWVFVFFGFVLVYICLQFEEGCGLFCWVVFLGDLEDIYKIDWVIVEFFFEDVVLYCWFEKVGEKVYFEGLFVCICWFGYKECYFVGFKFNEMVVLGEFLVLIVIGCDYFDFGLVVFLYCEIEVMKDGFDVIVDWFLLNVLFNMVFGVFWVLLYYGGGVGIGCFIYVGQVMVVDGLDFVVQKLEWVLMNDFGIGVMCYVDVGYEYVCEVVCECGLNVLMF